jgi:glycerol-3-phosphate dehydrogenase (NAD+)
MIVRSFVDCSRWSVSRHAAFTANKIQCADRAPQVMTDVTPQKTKVCIIGSGNWGSAIATIVGRNCLRHSHKFDTKVSMWVYEELIGDEKLSDIINTKHINVKYLPDVPLPLNIIAVPDLPTACRDATLLIFVLPHQFLPNLIPLIRASIVHPSRCRGISLIKGLGA